MESSGWYTKVFYGDEKDEKNEKKDDKEEMEKEEGAANLSQEELKPKEDENSDTVSKENDESIGFCKWLLFALLRILIIFSIAGLSFLIPNIHILLTLAGSILGTIVNIYLPVIFYNRAYNFSEKN